MKKNQLTGLVRGLMILCAIALALVLFVPLWQIQLSAPQYPEGLILLIYPGKLAGNLDIINGLNHYIGMKSLHSIDFIEFTVLPYIITFFVLLAAAVAIFGKRLFLNLFFILFVCFGILAMVDFWRWEYHYGHDLNPDAAIIVPGMAYQPPMIGYKQLLNFGAYSIPDLGGWLFIGVGLLSACCIWITWKRNRKKIITLPQFLLILILLTFVTSCNTAAEPIKLGSDNCYFCKMTISDPRYGAEIVTKKGRVYKFDDTHCLIACLKTKELSGNDIQNTYLTNFSNGHQLLHTTEALLLQSNDLREPMGGNIAAFKELDSLQQTQKQYPGTRINWNEIAKQ
jgi:copper chaperone NosL